MKENELNYGEVIVLTAFWEVCMYYIKKHKEKNEGVKIFSFVQGNNISIGKKNEMWYVFSPMGAKEFSDCFSACSEVLKYLSFTKEEEEELLKLLTNYIRRSYSYEEIEEKSKIFKKCII